MGLFDWFRKNKKQANAPSSAPKPPVESEHDRAVQAAANARLAYFRQLGEVSKDVLAPILGPMITGEPQWPTRPAWRPIRKGASTVLASDGLSDPFADESLPNTGFGVEILVETADSLGENLQASWLFHLMYQVSANAASHGGFRGILEKHGVVSMEIGSAEGLEAFENEAGRLGVLLGLDMPNQACEFAVPGGTTRVITAKLLTRAELEYVVGLDAVGRRALQEKFTSSGSWHTSSLDRPSVI